MAQKVQIQCIRRTTRTDPHECIEYIGGLNPSGTRWLQSQQKAVADIESGVYDYWVSVDGVGVRVIVAKHNGNKYIKTENDSFHPNNLLSLENCPITA